MRRTAVGGAAMPAALIRTFVEQFDVEVRQAWGMTETSPLGTVSASPRQMQARTVGEQVACSSAQGHPVFGVELALADPADDFVPHDGKARGELLVRGPWIAAGYLDSDAPMARTDGWFATGDIATIDPCGCMCIVDRVKDVIKSGVAWISSIELEDAAMAHDDIVLAAVIGVPDAKWGERSRLFVVARVGSMIDGNAMRRFLAERVPKWWLPEEIEFRDDLPIGSTGKVLKQALRDASVAAAGAAGSVAIR